MRSFTDEDREKSQINHRRNLLKEKSFEELGKTLRKKIVMEDQDFKCLHCNLNEWMGLRITLELDHIDGNRNNNKRENLRCLCPNCHSLTDTWKVNNNNETHSDRKIIETFLNSKSMNETLQKLNYNWGNIKRVKNILFKHKIIDRL